MSRRPPETLADYLVVAICPALIMLLVGSLMWFLVEVFYQGEYKGRLLWVMAMFVLAIVGIARIAMEKGMAYASMFGWALAAAIAMALAQFVKDGLIIGGPIMVLVWWAAHKLTWDCTLIDDTQDASGQGLLQQMGLDPSATPAGNAPPGTTTRAGEPEATTSVAQPAARGADGQDPSATPPWWETLLEPDRRPHAPGVWVVYFSLAALPLFGLGGWFVPSSDPVGRAHVFGLLVIYVASGMGLLLATSFLGLRRYLRQRNLEMPPEMTTTWILVGIVMIFAMLIVAAILPRPSREYSLSQLPFTVTSAVRRASRFAMGKEGTKDDSAKDPATTNAKDGQATERKGGKGGGESGSQQHAKPDSTAEQQQSGDKGGSGGKGSQGKGSGESGKSQSGGGSKGDKGGKSQSGQSKADGDSKGRNAESQSDEKSKGDSQGKNDAEKDQSRSGEERQQSQPPDPNATKSPREDTQQQSGSQNQPSAGQTVSNLTSLLGKTFAFAIKWLFYAGLVVGAIIAAWIYREELQAAWKKLMDELRELWDAWFGKKKAAEATAEVGEVKAPPRMFASFADPFASGDARGMSWPQLVRYTFEALEAWGREQGCPRAVGQTPHEFAVSISALEPQIAANVQTLAAWYSQLAYAPRTAASGSPEPLRQLWVALRERHTNLAIA